MHDDRCCRDNVEWGDEQEKLAEAKVRENSATMMPAEDTGIKNVYAILCMSDVGRLTVLTMSATICF